MKRFYKEVDIVAIEENWQILLDGKPIRTPEKQLLAVPTEKLAQAIADEWASQGDKIDLPSMKMMQFSCAALDYVMRFRGDVEAEMLEYAATDTLCYRSATPPELAEAQLSQWQPIITWAEKTFSVRIQLSEGIMPIAQKEAYLQHLLAELETKPVFTLTVLWLLTKHYASLLLALAVFTQQLDAEDAFKRSRLEETIQNDEWGTDEEAEERRLAAQEETRLLGLFLKLLQ